MAFLGVGVDDLDLAGLEIDEAVGDTAGPRKERAGRVVTTVPTSRKAVTWESVSGVRCIWRRSAPMVSISLPIF